MSATKEFARNVFMNAKNKIGEKYFNSSTISYDDNENLAYISNVLIGAERRTIAVPYIAIPADFTVRVRRCEEPYEPYHLVHSRDIPKNICRVFGLPHVSEDLFNSQIDIDDYPVIDGSSLSV